MQSTFTNNCKRTGRSKKLTEIERGTATGCHRQCKKSDHNFFPPRYSMIDDHERVQKPQQLGHEVVDHVQLQSIVAKC